MDTGEQYIREMICRMCNNVVVYGDLLTYRNVIALVRCQFLL